ncbi:zinc finger protein 572 [Drosophila albomicans]|uniref:Zinc finger protein 572 n=1 Tax=Drosophila albomicans TaxID=7291 RepID=A0A6P8ZF33_DROAB|nr:zinc finger protein 572 [Drosophila albomicans]
MEICIKWSMCRTCTNDTGALLQPLFDDPKVAQQLQQYAGVELKADDGLPDQICTVCVANLDLVHTFLTGCKKADEHLRNVVRRTMSSRSCFPKVSLESEEKPVKVATEARQRKQIISERNAKSLLTSRAKEAADETVLISSAVKELELSKITAKSRIDDEQYVVVMNPATTTDTDDSEYIITDHHYEEDDEQIEENNLPADERSSADLVAAIKLEQETAVATHSIDLGAACEPSNFPKHSCSKCGNSFPNRTQLKAHLRTHGKEKSFECELCGKRFNAACNLTTHIRTHTGEKPFECAHCSRRFADPSTHRKHERMHTNERPYACDICAKTFSLSTTLKAHFLSHSNEKPRKCHICNKGFRLPHQLKAHKKTHAHRFELGVTSYTQEEDEEDDYSRS